MLRVRFSREIQSSMSKLWIALVALMVGPLGRRYKTTLEQLTIK
jgi:hypothetical protein